MYLTKEEGANELRDRTMVIVSSRERKHLMSKPEIPMLKYFQVFLHVSKRKGNVVEGFFVPHYGGSVHHLSLRGEEFFQRHKITFKKSLRAAEQRRADVARARQRWMREQGMFDPARLVFIDETAANTKMVRLYDRCPRGERLIERAARALEDHHLCGRAPSQWHARAVHR
jgi:hypothetical protein